MSNADINGYLRDLESDRADAAEEETEDLAQQLGAITAAVGSWEHLPISKDLGLLDSIKAADEAYQEICEKSDEAMESTCQELLEAKAEIKSLRAELEGCKR